MLQKATLDQLCKHLGPKSKILMRADFNVPMKGSEITDNNRITATLPTIEEILRHKPKSLVMLSHLGRPKGKKDMKHSLKPIAQELSGLLDRKVTFLEDCVGDQVINKVNNADGEIFLCQNVRFHKEEIAEDINQEGVLQFRRQLSALGEYFVNDAFGAAHRAHSSVIGINHKYRVQGLLMQKQLKFFGDFMRCPKKPVLVILGGVKVSDKLDLLYNMIDVASDIIIGGGMRFPFIEKLYGKNFGKTSIHYPKQSNTINEIMEKARAKGVKIHFPIDSICAKEMKQGVQTKQFKNEEKIPDDMQAFDIGPLSIEKFEKIVAKAESIFWNGPMGVFELKEFRNGSASLLRSIVKQTQKGATSIVGGGDSASLVHEMGADKQLTYVSTGGGATLELLEGKVLPGIEALSSVQELD